MNKILILGLTLFFVFLILGFSGCAEKTITPTDTPMDTTNQNIKEEVKTLEKTSPEEEIIVPIEEKEIPKTSNLAKVNIPAELEKGALLYTVNGNVFSYKFQVMYKDEDGDMPIYMFVYINGSRKEMTKANASQIDPKEGILYILPMSGDELYEIAPKAKEWNISYWFRTNDGYGVVETNKMNSFVMDFEAMGLSMEGGAGNAPCNCGH
ncbi:MAG: hypothetical protein AMQ74_01530 [Candidatus Methanofastidiosum methylothiophilum]|uniref:Uncharacterized protein n=1 Tax=Candidatus Methanofastidiosum methylothiophilum TaxID=1705564 RepID=A0A150IVL8_9EURY|nr:MAG: hypothetical protein AMQ74_01530 [Candidatus Methanofastidiosum methylthiophilus]NMC77508.1 hypothetical protein [Candidatus Methanofastidiosa archaeon]